MAKQSWTASPGESCGGRGGRACCPRGGDCLTPHRPGVFAVAFLATVWPWPWRSGACCPLSVTGEEAARLGAVPSPWARPPSAQGHIRGRQKVEVTGKPSSLAHLFYVRLHFRGGVRQGECESSPSLPWFIVAVEEAWLVQDGKAWASRDRDESLTAEGGAVGFGAESLSGHSRCVHRWRQVQGRRELQGGCSCAQGRVSEEVQEKGIEWL